MSDHSSASHARTTPTSPRSLLLVDDDPGFRLVLAKFLREEGWTVHEASGGRMAIEHLHTSRPAVLMIDVFTPETSGLELLAEIRRLRPQLRVIALSGYPFAAESLSAAADAIGAVELLEKPFTPSELIDRLNRRPPSAK